MLSKNADHEFSVVVEHVIYSGAVLTASPTATPVRYLQGPVFENESWNWRLKKRIPRANKRGPTSPEVINSTATDMQRDDCSLHLASSVLLAR